jgi:2-oxoglutarate ferredoxin oxidoreductase subunit alpha
MVTPPRTLTSDEDSFMTTKAVEQRDTVTIRFAGDSGDGMQLTGNRFTSVSAVLGNDVATLPDFPAEIRAPAGSLPGVSGFQLHFADHDILTPGDAPDVLVAMNPAALKTNVEDLEPGATIIVNSDAFSPGNLRKARYDSNPLDDASLSAFNVVSVPLTTLTIGALEDTGLGKKEKERAKNMFALGLMSWMFSRPTEPTIAWVRSKFASQPELADANITALTAGFAFGETTELFAHSYEVPPADLPAGRYRQITGNTAIAYGLVAAAERSGLSRTRSPASAPPSARRSEAASPRPSHPVPVSR